MKSTSSSIDSIPSNVTCAHFSYIGLLSKYTDSIEVPIGAAYTISANCEKFLSDEDNIDLTKETTSIKVFKDLTLSPLEIGTAVKLNNVLFESGRATLLFTLTKNHI